MRPHPPTSAPTRAAPRTGPARSSTGRLLVVAAVLVLLVVALRTFVAAPLRVASASMEPTLGVGDVVLVSRSAPSVADLARGDLVVFRSPEDGVPTLKRVIGLPGESVVVKDGTLYVDDHRVREPYVDHATVDGYFTRTFTVPDGAVLVLGDNRANSVDSRDYGPVPQDALLGRVLTRVWPLSS